MIYFIVNTHSRTGKAAKIWEEVKQELKRQSVEFQAFLTEYVGHATQLATDISSQEIEVIHLVVVGGDGTFNEVLNGIVDFDKVSFGYIPTGSGNDLGRGLGIKGSPTEILQRVLKNETERRMDLGKVTYADGHHYFAISSGIGLDAEVCKMALDSKLKKFLNAIHLGKLTYLLLTLKALRTMPEVKVKVKLDNDEEIALERAIFAVAMNHKYEGGGIAMAPNASAFDGKLSLACVHGFSRPRALFSLGTLVSGKPEKIKGFDIYHCKSAQLTIEKPMVVHADGEYCGDREVITFSCEEAKLRLLGI